MKEDNQNKNNVKPETTRWHFWFLVSFSLLLIVVVVYWLTRRFLHEAGKDDGGNAHKMTMPDGSMMMDNANSQALTQLPLRTPANRVDRLPFVERDGVKEFRLEASEFRWEYEPGKWVHAWGYNGQIPGPEIRVNEGDRVRIVVKNSLPDATSVHWHGLDVPWQMDGVPGVTQKAIQPGETFIYEFDAVPAGTRFYHSHGKDHITSAQQMDMGLSGAFIVEDGYASSGYDKEFTLILDEWDIVNGINSAISHIHGAGEQGAVPEYNTFTINGRVFPYTDPLKIEEDDSVLIRFINVGTSASHPMHLHGHSFAVVARDGFEVGGYERRNTITINPGETIDIAVYGENPGPWLLHCHHVHHAAAGMITLMQYEGYEPVGAMQQGGADAAVTSGAQQGEDAEHMDHMMNDDMPMATQEEGDHAHPPGTPADHAHGDAVSTGGNSWWGLLVVSIILMILLSLGVKKYLAGNTS